MFCIYYYNCKFFLYYVINSISIENGREAASQNSVSSFPAGAFDFKTLRNWISFFDYAKMHTYTYVYIFTYWPIPKVKKYIYGCKENVKPNKLISSSLYIHSTLKTCKVLC